MNLRSLASLLALSLSLVAQGPTHNLVTNGDFTGTLTPWVMGGAYSVNPGLESGINVTGSSVSDSFGVNAGGQVTPPPYAPNTLEQTVSLTAGVTYEFRMDAIGYRNSTTGNADIGTIWVELEAVEIARFAFGSYVSPEQKRAQLCGRHTALATGTATIKIYFQRAFLGGAANPRMNIDNVSLEDTDGPTFCMVGNRRLGATVSLRVDGAPNAAYALFLAAGDIPAGLPIPGFGGLLHLDLATLTLFVSGQLDGSGNATTPFTIPNINRLRTVPLYYQPLSIGGTAEIGLYTCLVMTL